MSASDTSIFNQKNGTDEKPKAWLEIYGSKSSFIRVTAEKKNDQNLWNQKKSKHKKHPTIAKIDSHVDENGQLVVDCPDLWAGNSNAFYRVLYRFYLLVLIGQNLDFELKDISKCIFLCWCSWYHYWLWWYLSRHNRWKSILYVLCIDKCSIFQLSSRKNLWKCSRFSSVTWCSRPITTP